MQDTCYPFSEKIRMDVFFEEEVWSHILKFKTTIYYDNFLEPIY